jgi:hypothetical protein
MATDRNLDRLESHLAGTLKPVAPPGDLVRRLRLRLRMPAREEIVLRLSDWRRLLFVLGGVLSGIVAIVTLGRAIYHMLGRRDIA